MGVGDMLEIYNKSEWKCVATIFFIDTAHNIADYVEHIYQILQPEGLWVSFVCKKAFS